MKVYRSFIGQCPPEPLQKSKVTITRHGSLEPDKDNIYASVKPLVDALVKNGIIFDDAPQFVDLKVQYVKAKRKEAHTIIEIEEIEVHA
jgi:Holliday junction resolvase RusA-like endonuclease